MTSDISRALSVHIRYAPHVAIASVGYVMFSYAAVPTLVIDRYAVSFAAVGLLMSVILLSFTVVQVPGGPLLARLHTTRLLLLAVFAHAALAIILDFAPSFYTLLGLRLIWGLIAGLILTTGATHLARIYTGPTATRQQGIYGGMIAFGAGIAFLVTPQITTITGWFGVHAVGAILAVPALGMLWIGYRDPVAAEQTKPPTHLDTEAPGSPDVHDSRTPPSSESDSLPDGVSKAELPNEASTSLSTDTDTNDGGTWGVLTNPIVVLVGLCYVAIISGHVTLSTFITAYFDELGIIGPLNAAVLFAAALGRGGGGVVVDEWDIEDTTIIIGSTAVATVGFTLIMVGVEALIVILPIVTIFAVAFPFGAIFNVAADADPRQGAAIGVVVAMGNFAALILPAVTGWIRDVTGAYDGGFFILAVLNGIAFFAGIVVYRYGNRWSSK